MILDVDTVDQTESVNLEVDAPGNVLRIWNLADIVSAAMVAGGDDSSLFVYPAPTDWFHNNACAYRSSDNSLIVSNRENFLIAIDYDSGNIKWILGDPTGQALDILANCSRDALRNPFSQLRRMGQKGVAL